MRAAALQVTAAGIVIAGMPLAALAQTTRSGSGDAQVVQQLQQLTRERASLQQENTRLKQQLAEAQQKLDSASTHGSALAQRAKAAEAASSRLAASSASSTEDAARTKAQLQELVTKFRTTAQTLKDVETERNTLRQQAQVSERQLATCRAHNVELLTINDEILVRLENTGFWSKLAADEPFTRLKRTQLENLALEYRARATELSEAPAPVP